jgi:rhomboid protease GluP
VIPEPAPTAAPPLPIPWVSYTVLGLCVAVYLADELVAEGQLKQLMLLYGPAVAQGQWWRPFSTVFVHGNAIHLLLNMMVLMSLGRDVERGIGTFRFLIASIVGAMGASIAVLVWNFDQPTVGASGMILAWAGVLVPIANTAGRKQLGIWLLQMAVISLIPGISGAGHLGGFLAGLPCGWVMRRPRALFQTVAPILVFVAAALLVLAGTGRMKI